MNRSKVIAQVAGPVVAAVVWWIASSQGLPDEATRILSAAAWMLVWWIAEAVPLGVTSVLPMVLFPVMGIASIAETTAPYGSHYVFLFMGGFLIALALERWDLHRRFALSVLVLVGGNPRWLIAGFMAATAALSMWISNTSTTLMLLPVALAALEKSDDAKLAAPLLLGIAYAASIGGIGTPIGTPPNMVFMGVYTEVTGSAISFGQWMMWAVPVVVVLLPIAGFWITRGVSKRGGVALPSSGEWTLAERRVLTVFSVTAGLWMTRKGPWGGWSEWLSLPNANDAMVAFLAVVALFVIPSGQTNGKGETERLLDWETAERIPWGMLLLFGAGITIATGPSRW